MVTENAIDKEHKIKPPDGSPITIGGGGGGIDNKRTPPHPNGSCKFSSGDYEEPAGGEGKKTFQHPGWQIRTLIITTSTGKDDDLSSRLPPDGDCKIKVKFSEDEDDVTILGSDFGIKMNTKTYKKGRDPDTHTNPNQGSYLYEIKAVGFDYKRRFRKGECYEVFADHV